MSFVTCDARVGQKRKRQTDTPNDFAKPTMISIIGTKLQTKIIIYEISVEKKKPHEVRYAEK